MRIMRAVVAARPGDYDVMRQRLRPVITERFRLEEAPRVHRLMVERKLSGRVLLVP